MKEWIISGCSIADLLHGVMAGNRQGLMSSLPQHTAKTLTWRLRCGRTGYKSAVSARTVLWFLRGVKCLKWDADLSAKATVYQIENQKNCIRNGVRSGAGELPEEPLT